MGRKCSVPMCSSNYGTEEGYTASFQFPPDREEIWVRAINRADFQPSKTAVVCIKHFEEKYIIREDRVTRPDGSLLVVPRKKLALTADAIPIIFIGQPKYLTKTTATATKSTPDDRRNKIEQRDNKLFSLWCKNDEIDSYDSFLKFYKDKLVNNWQSLKCGGFVLFYIVDVNDWPRIRVSFEDLKVKVFSQDLEGKPFTWLLGQDMKCDKWTIFDNLLSVLSNPKAIEFSACEKLSVVQLLNAYIAETEDLEKAAKLEFLKVPSRAFLHEATLIQSSSFFMKCKVIFWLSSCLLMYKKH